MTKLILKLIPTSTIASLIAEYATKALSNVSDKERAAKISVAIAHCGTAVTTAGKAVEDCTITEDEVNAVKADVTTAVTAIINAAA